MGNCKVVNPVNGKESELQVDIENALLEDSLKEVFNNKDKALEYMEVINGPDFKEMFGDWSAEWNSGNPSDDMRNRTTANGEPQLRKLKNTNHWYFLDKNEDKFFINKLKLSSFESDEILEVTRYLSQKYLSQSKSKDFNLIETSDINKKNVVESIESSMESYIDLANEQDEYLKEVMIHRANLILDNKDEFKTEVISFIESLGRKFKESLVVEEYGEDVPEEDKSTGLNIKESWETNSKDSASVNTKIFLSQIENRNLEGEIVGGDYLFEASFVEFNEVWSTVQPVLTDIVGYGNGADVVDVLTVMRKELVKMEHSKPWMRSLIQNFDNLTEDKQNQFIQAFTKTKLNFYVTEVDGNKYRVINATSTGSRESQIVSAWGFDFQSRFLDKKGMIIDGRNKLEGIQEEVRHLYDSYISENSSVTKRMKNEKDASKLSELNEKKQESMARGARDLVVLMNKMGVHDVVPDDIDQFILNGGGQENSFGLIRDLFDKTKMILTDVLKEDAKFYSNREYINPLSNETTFKQLAKAIGVRNTDISDSSVLMNDGKSAYVYANPSYLSNKINEWTLDAISKEGNPSKSTLIEDLALNNVYNENSLWIRFLSGHDEGNNLSPLERRELSIERLKGFKSGLASSFKSRGKNDGSDNKNILFGDAINDNITKMLGGKIKGGKSYFPTIIPADKSRRIELEGLNVWNSVINLDNSGEILISKKTVKLFVNYFKDEYNRMRVVKREIETLPDTEKVVHYHTGAQNGKKSQIFPEFSHDNTAEKYKELRDALYAPDGTPHTDDSNKEFTDEQEAMLEKAINESLKERVKETRDELAKIDNINADLIAHYEANHADAATSMAGDYLVNGLIASIEYGKLFSGDPSYYKNSSDLIKRIPATYTDGLQLRLKNKDSMIFNHAVVEGVEVASQYIDRIKSSLDDESIAKAYEKVNTTDAQAWITPRRWRFLKQKLSQWGPLHESAYNKMIKGKDLSNAEMKVAAQPLKGVYFEINKGRPVYLKYSQAVLLPGMVKGTDMEMLLDKMQGETSTDAKGNIKYEKEAHEEIHEVITIDGIKVGAVAPTKMNIGDTTQIDPDFTLNSVELSNRGWKLQQDLPIKRIHETNTGSQIQKNILAGMALDSMYKIPGEQAEVSGAVLMQRIHDTVSELSNLGKANLEERFGIVDGKITDTDSIYRALIREFKDRGGNENVISALEKGTDFDAIPQIRNKVQSIFMSMMDKELINISTNGGSMIQVSPFGFEKVRGNYKTSEKNYVRSEKSAKKNGKFELNEGQKKAKGEILEFINNPERKTHSLIGYAGTGKTTLIKEIESEIEKDNPFARILYSAPTHRANAVTKLKNPDANVYTLHSLLGLSPEQDLEEFDADDAKYLKKGFNKVKSGDILIVDESSMINNDLYEMIKKFIVEELNAKVLFVGDDAQLKPVKQEKKSKALSSTEKVSSLTEIMRANNNSVLEESMHVRDTGNFTYTNTNLEGGVNFTDNRSEFLKSAYDMFSSDEFKKDPLLVRIISGTNEKANEYNSSIRRGMFGKDALDYEIGDVIMGYGNWGTDYKTGQPKMANGGDYKVINNSKSETRDIYGVPTKGRVITFKNLLNDNQDTFSAYVIDRDTSAEVLNRLGGVYEGIRREALQYRSAGNRQKEAKKWAELSQFKELFMSSSPITFNGSTKIPKTLDYGYAHTIHKSQGGTYSNVFIDEDTIEAFRDEGTKKQLRYVAVTRAEDNVEILTSKKIKTIEVEDPSLNKEVSEDENIDKAKDELKRELKRELSAESTNEELYERTGITITSKSYDGKGLLPPRKSEDGKTVLPGQAMMPFSDLQKILGEHKIDISGMSVDEILEVIDPEVLKVVTYRIPNQGMSSNDLLEIVGILPEGMGDSIIAYDAIPGKTGSDFDIDKMYLMSYNLEFRNGRVQKYMGQGKKRIQNNLVDLYQSVLASPNTYDALMTSIDGEFLKKDIADEKTGLFPAKNMGNLELFSPIRQIKTKFEYLSGKFGVAQTANQLVDHNLNQSLNVGLKTYIGIGEFDMVGKKKMTRFDRDPKGAKNSIAETLSSFLNAYVDIAKDSYISRANHNGITAGPTFMLIRAGVPVSFVNRFIGQPILFDLVDAINSSKGKTDELNKIDGKAVKDNYEFVSRSKGFPEMNPSDAPAFLSKLTESALEEKIGEGKERDDVFDAQILNAFKYLVSEAKTFNDAVRASKADTKGTGGSVVDRFVYENMIKEVVDVRGFNSKFDGTMLGTYTDNAIHWVGNVLDKSEIFMSGTLPMKNVFNNVSRLAGKNNILVNPDFGKSIEKGLYSYMTSGTDLFKDNIENFDGIMNNVPKRVERLKRAILNESQPENFFISELKMDKYEDYVFLGIDSNNKPTYYQDLMYRDWNRLYLNDRTKSLAVDLVRYSFLTSGFQNNLSQFFSHIPHEILSEMNVGRDIKKMKREDLREGVLLMDDNFTDQLFRHSYNDPSVVSRVNLGSVVPVYINGEPIDTQFGFEDHENGSDDIIKMYDAPPFKAAKHVSEDNIHRVILFKNIGFMERKSKEEENKGEVIYYPVYVRTHKLGIKTNKGSIMEYSYNKKASRSVIKENRFEKWEGNNIRTFYNRYHKLKFFTKIENISIKPESKPKVSNTTVIDDSPIVQVGRYKVVEIYDKIDNDSYSIKLNYNGLDYSLVIDRDGDITEPSYYDSNSLEDIYVNLNTFALSKKDVKDIFSNIESMSESAVPQENVVYSQNKLEIAGVKPTDSSSAEADIAMAEEATQFIGSKYKDAWGKLANTGKYSTGDVIMVEGSDPSTRLDYAQVAVDFGKVYMPLINKGIAAEASFVSANKDGLGYMTNDWLIENGYKVVNNNNDMYNTYVKENCN